MVFDPDSSCFCRANRSAQSKLLVHKHGQQVLVRKPLDLCTFWKHSSGKPVQHERHGKWSVNNAVRKSLNLLAVERVIVDSMAVEGQCRKSEKKDIGGSKSMAMRSVGWCYGSNVSRNQ